MPKLYTKLASLPLAIMLTDFTDGQPIAVCHWREVHVSSRILIAIALAGERIAILRLMLTWNENFGELAGLAGEIGI